ncbi:serine hydrolase [Anatilimnocola floriformis]|uniref:serine hydrolase n=1 Tax=Anatilimnocola floriformis TaxID=2948575 RepID=UPI0020C2D205|nr:serine hydrolase [Anatilimnocola floriformis]
MRAWFFTAFLIVSCASLSTANAAESLAEKLTPLLDAHEGKVTCSVKHLKTDVSFTRDAEVPMPTASLIKLAVMVEAYRQAEAGKVDLKKTLTLTTDDKVPGSGILTTHFSAGMTLPLQDAIHLMMVYSDNTATNLVLDQVGLAATNKTMESLNLPNTKIHSKVFRGASSILPERSKEFGLGSTTAGEMVQLLELLDQGKLASDSSTGAMRRHLALCESKRLSRDLPANVKVLQKTGSVNAVRTVAGIIETSSGNVAVCVLTNENKDRRWTDDNAGEVLSSKIAKIVFDHFQTGPAATDKAVLKLGSQGTPVEKLQAALNAQLKPSPELTLDGQFGPLTRSAVIAWQKNNQLPLTGEIDLAAWKKFNLAPDDFTKP